MSKEPVCAHCGAILKDKDEIYTVGGDYACKKCYYDEKITLECDYCGSMIWADNNAGDENQPLCHRCYDDYYTSCESCGVLLFHDDACYPDDDSYPYCSVCYDRYFRSIHAYSYKPKPIFHGKGRRFFGVELEIDDGGQESDNADKILEIANETADEEDENNLYIKHDGSLDEGMELVTHPMTLEYHEEEMPWRKILKKAREMGYYSHQTDTCGLHIHVNRTTFGSTREVQEECISRVLYFVEHHWEELLKFSRRTESQMNRWATRYGYKSSPKELLDHAKKSAIGHYACVNISNRNTIEFRFFRGTLKYNTLIAAIQLVDIICEYANTFNDDEIKAIGWTDFVGGIDEEAYSELITYLKERRLYVNEPVDYEEDD